MTEAKTTGLAAVAQIARYGETKAHLEAALNHLHTAMAITPWFEKVEPLGRIAGDVASMISDHAECFQAAIHGAQADDDVAVGGTDG